MKTFEIPAAGHLDLSVVIVNYGTSVWLQRCLQSLVANTPPRYEVIVVDNASDDDSAYILSEHLDGADVVVNEHNVGFGPACNQGALRARAPALCFLNPDALVQAGWLDPLLTHLDQATVGAAVPRLFNWDETAFDAGFRGTLQEAGCIVGADGSTQSVGYGDDPRWPWYRFPRVVDYGSAACMVVKRAAFDAVGGFDPVFAPAYCEDVDLCFRLGDAGWKTIYEPRAEVVHYRGAAMGEEERSALLEEKTAILRSRWAGKLAHRPDITALPEFAHRGVAARDALCPVRVMVTARAVDREVIAAASTILEALPDARLTVCAARGHPRDIEGLRRRGAEVIASPAIDWVDVLEQRWFQYDVVVDMSASPPLNSQVARTQPQAPKIDGADLPHALYRCGVAA